MVYQISPRVSHPTKRDPINQKSAPKFLPPSLMKRDVIAALSQHPCAVMREQKQGGSIRCQPRLGGGDGVIFGV